MSLSSPRALVAAHLSAHPELTGDVARNADWTVDALEEGGYAIVPAAEVTAVRSFLDDLTRLPTLASIRGKAQLLASALVPDESEDE